MDRPSTCSHLWREGDVVVIERDQAMDLPPYCLLTGERTEKSVVCLFHKAKTLVEGGVHPLHTLLNLLQFYIHDVDRVRVRVPLAAHLYRRWIWGWWLMSGIALIAIATICGLFGLQSWIDGLPKGEAKGFYNDLVVPGVALGGFALIAVLVLITSKIMPTLTTRLKPFRVDEDHIALEGAAKEYLALLRDGEERVKG